MKVGWNHFLQTAIKFKFLKTSGSIDDLGDLIHANTLLLASASTDGEYGFDIRYIGSRTINANSFALDNKVKLELCWFWCYQYGNSGSINQN